MKRFNWIELDERERSSALERPSGRADKALQDRVSSIVEDIRAGGWDALSEIARRIDGDEPRLIAVAPLADQARSSLGAQAMTALELAARNIRHFHESTIPEDISIETSAGLVVRKLWRPIDRVGLYVPGGKTPLFSTLLMLAIPARIAGVREIVTVTPPRPGGGLDPVIALAAELCGIEAIWTIGGAQAIAALAFGAGPIDRVDKICGPGNSWVAEAKRLVSSLPAGPAIDMPAGPSELMVIADDCAQASIVAADLLSQAEHDACAQVLLVTTSAALARAVEREIERQLPRLPRCDIARLSLGSAALILAPDLESAAGIANLYAPEHLALAVAEPARLIPLLHNAGAIFAGGLAAEIFGDYLAGSSHVLPTDGAARAWSGVSNYTFLKSMTVQTVSPQAAQLIAAPAALLARMEGLEAHARAADARLERAAR